MSQSKVQIIQFDWLAYRAVCQRIYFEMRDVAAEVTTYEILALGLREVANVYADEVPKVVLQVMEDKIEAEIRGEIQAANVALHGYLGPKVPKEIIPEIRKIMEMQP